MQKMVHASHMQFCKIRVPFVMFSCSVRFGFVLGPFWVRLRFVSNRFFQNFASCLHKKHGFAKRLSRFCIKKLQFWTPKWHQKGYFCHRWSLLSALGPFGKPLLLHLCRPGICKNRWENVFFLFRDPNAKTGVVLHIQGDAPGAKPRRRFLTTF